MTKRQQASDDHHHSLGSIVGLPTSARGPIAAALLTVFIGALDLTVIATILPRMIFDLGINTADIDRYIWVVNAYLLAYLIAIPIMGRVSDIIGRGLAFSLPSSSFSVVPSGALSQMASRRSSSAVRSRAPGVARSSR